MECKQLRHVETGVQVWREEVVIPTYPVGPPDKNPMFLEKRVYQGSSGRVYPHPVIEKIYDEPIRRAYRALCIENRYLFVMVLPELGGRIQRAYDKTNGYDFVYYNQVVKPALVGLTGPWISGGIEFNWPQHHRPSTFDPVDGDIVENADGSCSIVVGEIENMFRTKGMATMTLFPDTAYLKIDVRLYNRTPFPQTFLWWANPAVAVNDETQSIFPPDVQAVMDHGKRDVSTFPIATGTYYKQDYSAGVDISRYRNIPVPTSYMAYRSKYDFMGGYDYGVKAGLLHVADHHISPGKKQWTWGCGDFGKAWDRNLTDEDGPYIELMTGCFTDNQPDFTWLSPFEEKAFTQYFMPYKNIGMVKNANAEAAVTLTLENGVAKIGVYATSALEDAKVVLTDGGNRVFERTATLSPTDVLEAGVSVRAESEWELELKVFARDGRLILSYRPDAPKDETLPEPAKPAPLPKDAKTNEDLYLYGLHLEQYRHATYLPEDYYSEGLRRDPSDARINNAYGLLLMRRGYFRQAKQHFETAIGKLTRSNPNPYDGEPYYNLGICLHFLGEPEAAYDSLYKATWSNAQQEAAFYEMACIRAGSGAFGAALEHVERGLVKNAHNMKARMLKTVLLRKLERRDEAIRFALETLAIDHMDLAARNELALLNDHTENDALGMWLTKNHNRAIELALEYATAGFYNEASDILKLHLAEKDAGSAYPMVYYHLGDFAMRNGDGGKAGEFFALAAKADGDHCFPHRLEDMLALESALKSEPHDANGWYYLGNLLYDKRRYDDAITAWEKCRALDSLFPTARRNLALAYFNKRGDKNEARREMETAFALNPSDARVLMELDQLYKKLGMQPKERLERLKAHMDAVESRDDLYVEYITLENLAGCNEEALDLILRRRFHPWEGGEGKVSTQYVAALVGLGKRAVADARYSEALAFLKRATRYPENIGEGKLINAKENNVYYWMGVAYGKLNDKANAAACFSHASQGDDEPAGMMFYNDQPPEMVFYKGLALEALQKKDEAERCFDKLILYGQTHLNDHVRIDYFAVSLPDLLIFDEDLDEKNRVHCLFMAALGHIGKGQKEQAREIMARIAADNPNHQGIAIHRELLEWDL